MLYEVRRSAAAVADVLRAEPDLEPEPEVEVATLPTPAQASYAPVASAGASWPSYAANGRTGGAPASEQPTWS